jgi:hypothetical protein
MPDALVVVPVPSHRRGSWAAIQDLVMVVTRAFSGQGNPVRPMTTITFLLRASSRGLQIVDGLHSRICQPALPIVLK